LSQVHQPRRNASFTLLVQQRLLHPLEVHQPRRNAPFTWLVQQRLLHPLEGTNRASTAPTELTIRGYVEVRGGCVKTQLTRAESPTITFLVLSDSNRFFLCLLVKVLLNHWFWGCVKTRYGCIYLRYSASFATARARCEMPFLMFMPSCANDSS